MAGVVVDPDWLLSTVAQSAAALVAIIGGFLVSRVVTDGAHRSALIHQLADTRRAEDLLLPSLATLERSVRLTAIDAFLDYHLESFRRRRGESDAGEAVEKWSPRGGERSDMLAVATLACTVIAARANETHFSTAGYDPELVDLVVTAVEDASKKGYGLQALAVSITPDYVYTRREDTLLRRDDLRDRRRALQSERDALILAIHRLVSLKSYIRGLAVLTYLAGVGIVLPIILLAIRPLSDSLTIRRVVVGAFISGLALLVVYLVLAVRQLVAAVPEGN